MDDSTDGFIIVMGVTGAGKSYFLNKLHEKNVVAEGHHLSSETETCQAVQIYLDQEKSRSITVIDTPGFDDTNRSPAAIFAEITDYLTAQYDSGIPLRGVLFLHKITDNKMTGTSKSYLQLFNNMVGSRAMKNVILVTTMWNTLHPAQWQIARDRELELRDEFWKYMIDQGSYATRFDGSRQSALALIRSLVGKPGVVLDIQREVSGQGLPIPETTAGVELVRMLDRDRPGFEQSLVKIENELNRELRRRPVNKGRVELLKDEKKRVAKIVELMSSPQEKLKRHPGGSMQERLQQVMKQSGAQLVAALGVVLNMAYFIVQLTAGTA